MQLTDSPRPIESEWWWPSPEAFDDLEVTDIEEGWQLSAPDNSEMGDWLNYWSQSEEHHTLFEKVFIRALTDHANTVLNQLEQHGETENLPHGCQSNREQTQEECPGLLTEHESGSDSEPPQA
jgi:hypothetical protein